MVVYACELTYYSELPEVSRRLVAYGGRVIGAVEEFGLLFYSIDNRGATLFADDARHRCITIIGQLSESETRKWLLRVGKIKRSEALVEAKSVRVGDWVRILSGRMMGHTGRVKTLKNGVVGLEIGELVMVSDIYNLEVLE